MNSTERKPQLGFWWCFCCECDLYEITSDDDILEIESARSYKATHVWETKEDAIAELSRDPYFRREDIATPFRRGPARWR
jgi:hypothetical protein